jgi:hypothetical protein
MNNVLRYPLRNISPEKISDLQEKYPNASIKIELNDAPVADGLSEAVFWELINLLDWSKTGNDDAVIEPLVTVLSKGSLRHLYDFKDILAQKLYLIDTFAHAQNIGAGAFRLDFEDFSEDAFLFSRCCAVVNGQKMYNKIRKSPDLMPRDTEFAPVLRVANEAHKRMKGTVLRFVTAYSIETFSNISGWNGHI